jgi:hypothetical protein
MLQRDKEHMQWLSPRNMPFPECRDDYSWVPDCIKYEDLLTQKDQLKSEREAVMQMPRALNEVKQNFIESNQALQKAQAQELAKFILNTRHSDPANQLRFLFPDNFLRVPVLSKDTIDMAFSILEKNYPPDAISDADKKKKLSSIDNKIQKIDAELSKMPDYPKWQKFLDHWQSMQASCDAAITPQGFPLQSSPIPDEIDAFKKLGLGKLVSESNRYHPARD